MEKIKLAALQVEAVIDNKEKNFEKISHLLPPDLKADILILPELWAVGWVCDKLVKNAENIDKSETVEFLTQISKKYNINIIGGSFVEKSGGKYYNSCPVISRNGDLIAIYRKNHLFSYYDDSENQYITQGSNPVIVDIDGIKTGLSICYDIRFPEIYRAYRLAGADLLINAAAWPLSRKIHWDCLSRARAIENQTYTAAITQTGTLPTGKKNLGHSVIYDYGGNVLSEITEIEGFISAEINLPEMYSFRDKCTVLKDIHKNYEVVFR